MSNTLIESGTPAPIVSVVVAVHNGGCYLGESIESVLRQTFSDFEVLLIDDGSTDDSLDVMTAFAERDKRCHVFSGPNRGVVAARNRGLAASRGEFVAIMDADDICRPRRLERQLAYMRHHSECVAVGSRVLFIDPEGLPLCEMLDVYSHEEIENALLATRLGIVHPSCTFRRSALKTVGGYRPGRAEDLDLYLRLGEVGRLANLQEVLLEYRQHMASVSYDRVVEQAWSARHAVMAACMRRGLDWGRLEAAIPEVGRRPTQADVYRKWGWWALAGGNLRVAQKHTLNALKSQPLSRETWRLLACVLRGH